MEEDEFLVLACDGVWDVMTNEDICQFVAARMRITDDLELIANEVIDTCLHKVGTLLHELSTWDISTFIVYPLKESFTYQSSLKESFTYQSLSLQGSRDNMSIIIIAFPAAPKASSEAIKAEKELNDLLKQKVTGI